MNWIVVDREHLGGKRLQQERDGDTRPGNSGLAPEMLSVGHDPVHIKILRDN